MDFLTQSKKTLQRQIDLYGSPLYTVEVPAIAAGDKYAFTVFNLFPRARKYEPLDTIHIVNGDICDFMFGIDGNNSFPVPHNGTLLYDDLPAREIRITNLSGVASTNKMLVVVLSRSPLDADKVARGAHA